MTRYVYIVDDDDPVRASLHSLLTNGTNLLSRGFRTGDLFLSEMADLDPGLVLLDVNMPGTSGLDVLRELTRVAAPFDTIVITGQGNIGTAVVAMKNGAIDFLEKPYDPDLILEIVEEAFERREATNKSLERQQAARASIDRLAPRERDVLMGLIAGRSNKLIAYDLDISPRTVEIYRANLMTKLAVRSLSEALRIAFAAGLIDDQ